MYKRQERHISDKERLEFVAQKGAKGIDEIFKDKPTEMAAFLEKHKLSKDLNVIFIIMLCIIQILERKNS